MSSGVSVPILSGVGLALMFRFLQLVVRVVAVAPLIVRRVGRPITVGWVSVGRHGAAAATAAREIRMDPREQVAWG